MKWTPEKIAQLRELAPSGLGSAFIAIKIGTSENAVTNKAGSLRISIARRLTCFTRQPDADASVRERWSVLIGPMKEQLRAEIAGIG